MATQDAILNKSKGTWSKICIMIRATGLFRERASRVDAEDFRWQLLKSNWFTYAKLYVQAYIEYRKGPAELFDSRCR